MDRKVIQFYKSLYEDGTVDRDEANELNEFLCSLNPPPDKLFWLRKTAFKVACQFLEEHDTSIESLTSLLRSMNCIVHAIEENCMDPIELSNCSPIDEDSLCTLYNNTYDNGLLVDEDETNELKEYYTVTNPPDVDSYVTTRALAFKVATEHLQPNNVPHNTKVLKCINSIIHAFECACYRPKSFTLRTDDNGNNEGNSNSGSSAAATAVVHVSGDMSLNEAVQQLWNLDVNRLTLGDEIVLNVQEGKKPFIKDDYATDPLFTSVDKFVWQRPTYQAFVTLLDNYDSDTGRSEKLCNTERSEVTNFLDAIYSTGPMQFCHKYCHLKNPDLVPNDKDGFIQLLHTIWFDLYNRDRNGPDDSSGFEHVFVGEVKDGEISGFHNWIQFYLEEKKGHVDYRGYIKPRGGGTEHNCDDHLLTLQFRWKNVEKFVGTSFIGVSPEYEMALYTTCFLIGENEENHVTITTESDTFDICIKCYKMDGNKIGTSFPEITNHESE